MLCPLCESNRLSTPRYGAVPGGRRATSVRTCLDCLAIVPGRGLR